MKSDRSRLSPNRERKKLKKEASWVTSHLVKVSKLSKTLNVKLGIGRSMCDKLTKDNRSTVRAGLGVLARQDFNFRGIICLLENEPVLGEDKTPGIITRADGERMEPPLPLVSYPAFRRERHGRRTRLGISHEKR